MLITVKEFTQMFLIKKYRRVVLLVLQIVMVIVVHGQTPSESDTVFNKQIISAILKSDVNGLAKYFHSQIDLLLLEESGIYSKVQATFILKEFFNDNHPESFNIINENNNKGSNFIVGKLHTHNKQYRVCFLIKQTNDKTLIYQVRIEE